MDNWGVEETKKDNTATTKKILIAIMALLVIIIIVIALLLVNIKANTFKVLKDGKTISNTTNLFKNVGDTTYFNVKNFASIVNYEYHIGEYKTFSSDEDKCYVQSKKATEANSGSNANNAESETASFYLNSNKVCKLKAANLEDDYDVFTFDKNTIQIDNEFYAPLDAIEVGFNVKVTLTKNRMNITTLNSLISSWDSHFASEGTTYMSLSSEELDNQKAVLYNYLILAEKDSDLYGVKNSKQEEILPNKYKKITFVETTKEFIVTNSQDKMGIVDSEGKNKIEQLYDSIKVINSDPKLYLVQLEQKYGVLDEEGQTVVYPEYDSIGADTTVFKNLQNQYVLLDSVIPVCKEKKYGLFDVKGNKLLDVKYDGIGYEKTSATINGTTKTVNPTVEIDDCNGIVVKEGETYNLYIIGNTDITKLRVESIYYISSNGEKTYYMVYNGKEINLIDRLIEAKIVTKEEKTNVAENTTNTNMVTNNVNPINQNTRQ